MYAELCVSLGCVPVAKLSHLSRDGSLGGVWSGMAAAQVEIFLLADQILIRPPIGLSRSYLSSNWLIQFLSVLLLADTVWEVRVPAWRLPR